MHVKFQKFILTLSLMETPRPPNIAALMVLFFLVGPCLWALPFALYGILNSTTAFGIPSAMELLSIPFAPIMSAVMWWVLVFTGAWAATIAPTALAALFTWLGLHALFRGSADVFAQKGPRVAYSSATAALSSAAAFLAVLHLSPSSTSISFIPTGILPMLLVIAGVGACLGAIASTLFKPAARL